MVDRRSAQSRTDDGRPESIGRYIAVMASQPINLSDGLGETVLPVEPSDLLRAIDTAVESDDPVTALESVVAGAPRSPLVWAALGDHETTTIRRYAAYRVGYHRGLDSLRANGWRGSGFVRWGRGGNDGFLRCLVGLREMALAIDEDDEADRIDLFLVQLDPRSVDQRSVDQRALDHQGRAE